MILLFAVLLVIVAVLTKVVGCGLGAKLCHYSNQDALRIGMGMVSRGEVALIVASKGNAVGLMAPSLLGPVVVVVVITTIISPVLLKMTFHSKKTSEEYMENGHARAVERDYENAHSMKDTARYVGDKK